MTDKRFIKGYHTIRDTKENKTYDFRVDIICGLLNELDEKWINEFSLRETLQLELQRVEEENKQLKKEIERITKAKENWAFISDCSVQVMNEEEKFKEDYLRIATNDLKKLQEENEQLKEEKQLLYEDIDFLRIFIEKQGFKVKLDSDAK